MGAAYAPGGSPLVIEFVAAAAVPYSLAVGVDWLFIGIFSGARLAVGTHRSAVLC